MQQAGRHSINNWTTDSANGIAPAHVHTHFQATSHATSVNEGAGSQRTRAGDVRQAPHGSHSLKFTLPSLLKATHTALSESDRDLRQTPHRARRFEDLENHTWSLACSSSLLHESDASQRALRDERDAWVKERSALMRDLHVVRAELAAHKNEKDQLRTECDRLRGSESNSRRAVEAQAEQGRLPGVDSNAQGNAIELSDVEKPRGTRGTAQSDSRDGALLSNAAAQSTAENEQPRKQPGDKYSGTGMHMEKQAVEEASPGGNTVLRQTDTSQRIAHLEQLLAERDSTLQSTVAERDAHIDRLVKERDAAWESARTLGQEVHRLVFLLKLCEKQSTSGVAGTQASKHAASDCMHARDECVCESEEPKTTTVPDGGQLCLNGPGNAAVCDARSRDSILVDMSGHTVRQENGKKHEQNAQVKPHVSDGGDMMRRLQKEAPPEGVTRHRSSPSDQPVAQDAGSDACDKDANAHAKWTVPPKGATPSPQQQHRSTVGHVGVDVSHESVRRPTSGTVKRSTHASPACETAQPSHHAVQTALHSPRTAVHAALLSSVAHVPETVSKSAHAAPGQGVKNQKKATVLTALAALLQDGGDPAPDREDHASTRTQQGSNHRPLPDTPVLVFAGASDAPPTVVPSLTQAVPPSLSRMYAAHCVHSDSMDEAQGMGHDVTCDAGAASYLSASFEQSPSRISAERTLAASVNHGIRSVPHSHKSATVSSARPHRTGVTHSSVDNTSFSSSWRSEHDTPTRKHLHSLESKKQRPGHEVHTHASADSSILDNSRQSERSHLDGLDAKQYLAGHHTLTHASADSSLLDSSRRLEQGSLRVARVGGVDSTHLAGHGSDQSFLSSGAPHASDRQWSNLSGQSFDSKRSNADEIRRLVSKVLRNADDCLSGDVSNNHGAIWSNNDSTCSNDAHVRNRSDNRSHTPCRSASIPNSAHRSSGWLDAGTEASANAPSAVSLAPSGRMQSHGASRSASASPDRRAVLGTARERDALQVVQVASEHASEQAPDDSDTCTSTQHDPSAHGWADLPPHVAPSGGDAAASSDLDLLARFLSGESVSRMAESERASIVERHQALLLRQRALGREQEALRLLQESISDTRHLTDHESGAEADAIRKMQEQVRESQIKAKANAVHVHAQYARVLAKVRRLFVTPTVCISLSGFLGILISFFISFFPSVCLTAALSVCLSVCLAGATSSRQARERPGSQPRDGFRSTCRRVAGFHPGICNVS
jgi:hypothetical protein